MNKTFAALSAATAGLAVLLTAGVAGADPVTDAITDVQDTFTGYATPLAAAVLAITVAFVGIPLIYRMAKMVRRAIG